MGVELSRTRKKLVATANRHEGVLSRTGEPSVTFCEKEEQGSGRMAYFLSQTKNKPEQSELCSDVAEKEGFEPSRRFCRLHEFQSCALDQARRLLHLRRKPLYQIKSKKSSIFFILFLSVKMRDTMQLCPSFLLFARCDCNVRSGRYNNWVRNILPV